MQASVSKITALLAVVLAMAFSLLLTIALMERFVAPILFGGGASVPEADIRRTFAALKLLVGALPYTLGLMIAGSLILAIAQTIGSRGAALPVAVLLILLGPVVYNVVLTDTAAVVANLEATQPGDEIGRVTRSLTDAVRQHYVALAGFGLALVVQIYHLMRSQPLGRTVSGLAQSQEQGPSER